MQKINFLTLSTIASLVLIGCGGNSSTPSNTNTGTGYYKDSAIAGVDYVCGTETGKTDKEGKFTFEKGKECKFSLAGVPLRTTSADKLIDGGTILENNPKVAKFLQSIDADGDLSNGIEIDDKVLAALTDALANIDDDTTVLSDDTILTTVVAEVGSQVSGVSGTVRTNSEVQEHLAQTQTEITKELLAGKTFYVSGKKDDDSIGIFKIIVNSDATVFKIYKLDGTFEANSNVTIVGNKLTLTEDTDGSYSLISQKNGYIFVDDRNADGTKDGTIAHRLYANEADAKTYLDSLSATDGVPTDNTNAPMYNEFYSKELMIFNGVSNDTVSHLGRSFFSEATRYDSNIPLHCTDYGYVDTFHESTSNGIHSRSYSFPGKESIVCIESNYSDSADGYGSQTVIWY